MILPKPLKPGDFVAVVAPSSPALKDKIEAARESIKFLGLRPVLFKSCYMNECYLSGPDETRANDVNEAFYDSSIKGIFCIRGGYGSTRILQLLDYEMIAKHPKPFIGYSDITALHIAFNQLCGFITFHGPMPSRGYESMDAFSRESLINNIFNTRELHRIRNPLGQKIKKISNGNAQGKLVGGNLAVIASTLGSSFEIDATGKILFLEEVNEPLYKIDRSLTALKLAGKLENLAGVILGSFSDIPDIDEHDLTPGQENKKIQDTECLDKLFNKFFAPLKIPVMSNLRCGHVYPQVTLPMGMEIRLNISV